MPAFVSRASDVSLVEEARAYESNRSFAEGAPSPRLGPRVDPRPPHEIWAARLFDVSTADSCGPGGTTRRLQESAPVVVAGYSIGVKSQNVAEASAIANILGRFDRQSFGRHRRHLGHELAAALHTYPFPHAFPRVGPWAARPAFPLPPDPDSTRPTPDEETRTVGGVKKEKKHCLAARSLQD